VRQSVKTREAIQLGETEAALKNRNGGADKWIEMEMQPVQCPGCSRCVKTRKDATRKFRKGVGGREKTIAHSGGAVWSYRRKIRPGCDGIALEDLAISMAKYRGDTQKVESCVPGQRKEL